MEKEKEEEYVHTDCFERMQKKKKEDRRRESQFSEVLQT